VGSVSAAACLCDAGYTGAECAACAAGKFKDTLGPGACSVCRGNSTVDATAIKCLCDAGYTGPDGLAGQAGGAGSACSPCVAGTYKAAAGSAECTVCPFQRTSPAGSASVDACFCAPRRMVVPLA
jgi:hypothetical protein